MSPRDPTHVLSYSAISQHRTCPQAWGYRYVRRIEPDRTVPPARLELGSWWHALRAADSIKRGMARESLVSAPERLTLSDSAGNLRQIQGTLDYYLAPDSEGPDDYFRISAEKILSLAGDWWERQSSLLREDWESELGADLPTLLTSMNDRYMERWKTALRHEEPLGVEVSVARPLPFGSNMDPTFFGIVDEVYLDTRRGLVVARDHKSEKEIDAAEAADDLSDSQLHLYVWAIAPTVERWGRGPVRVIEYDRARTKYPATPAITQSGTLSKSTTDFDLATYLSFVGEGVAYPGRKKDGSQAGVYTVDPKEVDRLVRPDTLARWNRRKTVPLSTNVIRSHLRAARSTWRGMRESLSEVRSTGETGRNIVRRACSWCDFASLCRSEMLSGTLEGPETLGDYGLRLRDEKPGKKSG